MNLLIPRYSHEQLKTIIYFSFFILLSSLLSLSLSVFVIQIILSLFTLPIILKKDIKSINLYLIIFIVSLFFVFIVYYGNLFYLGTPYFNGGSDDLTYERQAMTILGTNMYNPAEVLDSGIIGLFHNSTFYVVLIASSMKFANLIDGYSTFIPRIFNVYLLIWSCFIIEYFLRKYSKLSDKKIYIVLGVFALTPNIHYINAHVFRDTLNLFQILYIVYFFDKITEFKNFSFKIPYAFILWLLIFISYYTRANSILFSLSFCTIMLSYKLKIGKLFIFVPLIAITYLNVLLENLRLDHYIEIYSSYLSTASADGLSKFVFNRSILPFGIVLRSLYAFITPPPLFFNLFRQQDKLLFDFVYLLIYIGVVLQIYSLPFVIKRVIKLDWIAFVFLTFFYAIVLTTFTFRHTMLYYPFLVILGVDGFFSSSVATRKYTVLLTGFVIFSMSIFYLILKYS
jgi:hypothetical protein